MKQLDVLFDPQARERWTVGKALVPIERDRCPQCLGSMRSTCTTEMASVPIRGNGLDGEPSKAWTCETCLRAKCVEAAKDLH